MTVVRRLAVAVTVLAVAAPLAGCQVKPTGGTPGTPHAPVVVPEPGVYRTVYAGVAIRRYTNPPSDAVVTVQGRITLTIKAFDSQGNPGRMHERPPVMEGRPSGFEYPVSVEVTSKLGVRIKVTAVVSGREAGERLDCWIRDEFGNVLNKNWHNMDPFQPAAPHDVECGVLLLPSG